MKRNIKFFFTYFARKIFSAFASIGNNFHSSEIFSLAIPRAKRASATTFLKNFLAIQTISKFFWAHV
jgi:hypothetical protein